MMGRGPGVMIRPVDCKMRSNIISRRCSMLENVQQILGRYWVPRRMISPGCPSGSQRRERREPNRPNRAKATKPRKAKNMLLASNT